MRRRRDRSRAGNNTGSIMRLQTVISAARLAGLAAAFCCVALAANSPAEAQTMAQPGQNPKAAAAADDPAKVAAARQFIIVYHPRTDPKFVAAMLDKVLPRIAAAIKKENPKADAKKLAEERRAAVLKTANTALDRQAHVVS